MLLPLPSCDLTNLPLSALQGGYNFLDLTQDNLTYHPGVDLNTPGGAQADCNAPIRREAAANEAQYTPTPTVHSIHYWPPDHPTGFGNHIYIKCDDNTYEHYCHLDTINPDLAPNTPVPPGTLLGTCGRTGNWPYCHLHFEVLRHAPPTPDFWPKGASRAFVAAHYIDPWEHFDLTTPQPTDQRPTLLDYANALRLANLQKHEMEAYITDLPHRASVDEAAQAENNPPILLMLRWAQDHYAAGDTAP